MPSPRSVAPSTSTPSPVFFFNDTATTEIYTLSLHDALPISDCRHRAERRIRRGGGTGSSGDRKSTRLNSSHDQTSYAVFCLKKKKITAESLLRRPYMPIVLYIGTARKAAGMK